MNHPNRSFYLLMCVFCWLGCSIASVLELYMVYMMFRIPEVEVFRRNVLLVLPLLLLWLVSAVWFTVRFRRSRDGKDR